MKSVSSQSTKHLHHASVDTLLPRESNPFHKDISIKNLYISSVLWSKPIPLAWFFGPQWRQMYGNLWPEKLCDKWMTKDRNMKDYANSIPVCPCTLDHALNDKGRFLPDLTCKVLGNVSICSDNDLAKNCFKSGLLR